MFRFWLLSALTLPLAMAATAQVDRFAERAEVTLVEVPVQVIAGGEPVRGLTAADFRVSDDGRPREIVDFEVVDLLAASAAPEAVPAHARRHLLLLFDLSFSDPASIERSRQAGRQVVAEALHPSDLVAVATYTASRGAQLVLGFTSDHSQAVRALDMLASPQPIRHLRDPLALTLDAAREVTSPMSGGGDNNKALRYSIMVENFRDMQTFETRNWRQLQERDVLALASSFEQLAQLMRGVAGRKQVVLLSEGFDSSIIVGAQDVRRQMEIASDSMAGEVWRVDSEERFGSNTAKRALETAIEEFRRADCVIQAVDIGGGRPGPDGAVGPRGHEGLFLLADSTGGELYRNHNQIGAAMTALLERTSVTYVLSFYAPDLERDGSFHRLKVRLDDGPRGARLLHRPGYYAPLPYSELSLDERRIATAGLVMGGEEGGALPVDVLLAPLAAGEERSYVPVLVEIDGAALVAGSEEAQRLEIYVYAISERGGVEDYLAQFLSLESAESREVLARGGYKLWGHLRLRPDHYVVRVLVRNAASGATGLRLQPLAVPDPADAAPTLLPPFFPEERDHWLLGQEGTRPELDYPFLLAGEAFVPAARPVLGAGRRTALTLLGYNLGDGIVGGRAVLTTPDGETVAEAPIDVTAREAPTDQGLTRLAAELGALAAAPGEYRLAITLAGPAGAIDASEPIAVVIAR